MANQLGSPLPSPRSYDQHQRHGKLARVRHAVQFKHFLSTQATRLSSTSTLIFGKLVKNTTQAIKKAATYGALR